MVARRTRARTLREPDCGCDEWVQLGMHVVGGSCSLRRWFMREGGNGARIREHFTLCFFPSCNSVHLQTSGVLAWRLSDCSGITELVS